MHRASKLQIQDGGEENCSLLGYYKTSNGNFLPAFRDNLSAPSSKVKNQFSWNMKMGSMGCPEMSVRNYYFSLRNDTEERSSYILSSRSLKYTKILVVWTNVYRLHWRRKCRVPLKRPNKLCLFISLFIINLLFIYFTVLLRAFTK